jgi:hypothetical protein
MHEPIGDPNEQLKAVRARSSGLPPPLVGALIILGMFAAVIAVLILSNAHGSRPI